MRTICSALLVAGAVTLATSSGSTAAPIDASAIKAAADEIAVGESVHCRPYRHWHRGVFGRHCGGGVVIYDRGPRWRGRVGMGMRDGYRGRDRDGVSIRSRESTTIRRGGDGMRGGRDGATIRGTTTNRGGDNSQRGNMGAGRDGGGNAGARTGGGGGRSMNTAPAGQTPQGGGAGQSGGQGGGLPGTTSGAGGGAQPR